eukprot:gene43079-52648_t
MGERILAQFEEFCVVTQSVRASIPVTVRVLDATGADRRLGDPPRPMRFIDRDEVRDRLTYEVCIPLVRDATRAFGVHCVELAGYEADDLIATYACKVRDAGGECVIVSSDKDLMQLIGPSVVMWDPMKDRRLAEEAVMEKFGEYGISILQVQEIRSYEPPTAIANAPAVLRGVIDLRGVITPIVDLRLAFGQAAPCTAQTGVIVLNLGGRVAGIVVDAVSDVLEIPTEQVRPAPEISSAVDSSCILGLGQIGERMLILLDIEKLMSDPGMGLAE